MYFTHRPLVWSHQTAADLTSTSVVRPFLRKKVVLLSRYPLDALVSGWFQFRYRGEASYKRDLETFLDDPVLGLEKLIVFYNIWAEWKDATRGILLLRYEDMSLDTRSQLQRLLEFLDIDVNFSMVNEAVDYASFNNMKKIEMSGKAPRYKSSGLNVFATGDVKNPNTHHVRRGIVGDYKNHLKSDLWEKYEALIASKMHSCYGYCNFSQSY
jgi:alcohol sulfotransferase